MPDLADTRSSKAGLGLLTGQAAAAATGGNDVLVDISGVQVTAHTLRAASVTSGDPLLIARQGSQYWVLGPANAGPLTLPTDDPVVAPKPVTRTGKLVVSPVETRSYRAGKWRTVDDDTYQGETGGLGNYTGAAFYGNKPSSLAGSTCTRIYLRLRRRSGLGDYHFRWVQLWTIEERTRAETLGGAVTRIDNTDGPGLRPGDESTWQLPTAWGQKFIDGDIGGLACYDPTGDNYMGMNGRGGWSAAWTIAISWTRTS